jgi:hypothetical protein
MTDGLTIENSTENFETWIAKDFVSDELKPSLHQTSILLVPTIGFRKQNEPTFPVLTEDLYYYFKENLPKEYSVELCIDESKYLEIALHSNYKRIGNFIVKDIVLPIFIGLLVAYITEKYIRPEEAKPHINIVNIDNSSHTTIINEDVKPSPKIYLAPTKVTFSVTVVDTNGTSKEYKYEGEAKDVKVVTEEIKKLWDNDKK